VAPRIEAQAGAARCEAVHHRGIFAGPFCEEVGLTPGEDTRRWRELDRRHHLHPFTNPSELAGGRPRIITRAEGCWLWDSEGHEILDGMAGLWCVNVGYGRAELVEAARRQMMELP
jgi:putrescine aminotransferase